MTKYFNVVCYKTLRLSTISKYNNPTQTARRHVNTVSAVKMAEEKKIQKFIVYRDKTEFKHALVKLYSDGKNMYSTLITSLASKNLQKMFSSEPEPEQVFEKKYLINFETMQCVVSNPDLRFGKYAILEPTIHGWGLDRYCGFDSIVLALRYFNARNSKHNRARILFDLENSKIVKFSLYYPL